MHGKLLNITNLLGKANLNYDESNNLTAIKMLIVKKRKTNVGEEAELEPVYLGV